PYLGRGRFQVVDVVPRALSVAHADRRIARRGFPARAARVAEHALGEVRKFDEVLVYEGVARAAEAVEAILDVGSVAVLRHLAVADDVDARPGLLVHHVLHRGADARGAPCHRPARPLPWRTSCPRGPPAAPGSRRG